MALGCSLLQFVVTVKCVAAVTVQYCIQYKSLHVPRVHTLHSAVLGVVNVPILACLAAGHAGGRRGWLNELLAPRRRGNDLDLAAKARLLPYAGARSAGNCHHSTCHRSCARRAGRYHFTAAAARSSRVRGKLQRSRLWFGRGRFWSTCVAATLAATSFSTTIAAASFASTVSATTFASTFATSTISATVATAAVAASLATALAATVATASITASIAASALAAAALTARAPTTQLLPA